MAAMSSRYTESGGAGATVRSLAVGARFSFRDRLELVVALLFSVRSPVDSAAVPGPAVRDSGVLPSTEIVFSATAHAFEALCQPHTARTEPTTPAATHTAIDPVGRLERAATAAPMTPNAATTAPAMQTHPPLEFFSGMAFSRHTSSPGLPKEEGPLATQSIL